jgi:hypothetical protein
MAMRRNSSSTLVNRGRLLAGLALVAVSALTTGFSSCAGTTGPLFVPITITPAEVLLRASLAGRQEAVGLARVDGGDDDHYRASIGYDKAPPANWLVVETAGRNLTLRAKPDGLAIDGYYTATVTVEGRSSGATGSLRVEFSVIR